MAALPQEFQEKMCRLLGPEEFRAYTEALSQPQTHGLRANGLRITRDALRTLVSDALVLEEDVPWSRDGMYFRAADGQMPGRSVYYLAGLYYIQEPSAMYPAEALQAEPGDRVLDLCAAPGGKSTALAAQMQGRGVLVANDISAGRAGTLLYNLELAGVENAVVTNEDPQRLAERFPLWFDKILIDAPCSGEGMFRKDADAVQSWGTFKNEVCCEMQRAILEAADHMLRPGGILVYSTCTFDPRENEEMIARLAQRGYTPLPLAKPGGIADGIADPVTQTYGPDAGRAAQLCARLWPHRLRGEGHFTAKLRKNGDAEGAAEVSTAAKQPARDAARKQKSYRLLPDAPAELRAFCDAHMTAPAPEGYYYQMGDQLFLTPFAPLPIDGLTVLRMGVHVGTLHHGKLKPAQAFVMSRGRDAFRCNADLRFDSDAAVRYVRGESLTLPDAPDGLCAVRVTARDAEPGFILGLAEARGGVLKNLYPKGWRRML